MHRRARRVRMWEVFPVSYFVQGFNHVGTRLLSATVVYEETGWYDGQVCTQPAQHTRCAARHLPCAPGPHAALPRGSLGRHVPLDHQRVLPWKGVVIAPPAGPAAAQGGL